MEEALSIYGPNLAERKVLAQFLYAIKTSAQPAMYFAIYNSEEDADNALAEFYNTFELWVNGYMTSFTIQGYGRIILQ